MSYILDALRKSDQQRQRGATPTLPMGQPAALAPNRPAYVWYGLLAAILLGAGIAIGWLRPWQAEQPAPMPNVVAAKPPDAGMRQSVLVPTETAPAPGPAPVQAAAPAPARARASTAPARTAPAPAPVRAPAPAPKKSKPSASVSAELPGKAQDAALAVSGKSVPAPEQSPSAAAAPVQNVIWLSELPLALQQELPPMTISVHAYSSRPADRLVGINDRMLREGDSVVPGLKLEQITPEGMVFGYKGYSFRRGVK